MSQTLLSPSPVRQANAILVVEDEEAMRTMIGDSLRYSGYEVVEALDTDDAFKLAHERRPNGFALVVTDVVMPKMDGRDLARWMRGAYPHTKILFVSGKPGHRLNQPGVLGAGMDFLQKPFSIQELIDKVRAIMAKPE